MTLKEIEERIINLEYQIVSLAKRQVVGFDTNNNAIGVSNAKIQDNGLTVSMLSTDISAIQDAICESSTDVEQMLIEIEDALCELSQE